MPSMDPLLVVCFSKNRPLQLAAYLDSLDYAFGAGEISPVVIYAGSGRYAEAYDRVRRRSYIHHPTFIEEAPDRTIKESLRKILASPHQHMMFGCDDVIFTRTIDSSWRRYLTLDQFFGFSFRLGENITYCHPADQFESFSGQRDGECLTWEWPGHPAVDFAYAFELNATVYRRQDVSMYLTLLDDAVNWHPNIIESRFYRPANKTTFLERPFMASYIVSHAYVLTVNRVQDVAKNPIYEEYSAEALLDAFNQGARVDLRYYRDKVYPSIHIGDFKLRAVSR